ncbi:hypothetical protein MF406_10660 [Georgenia sp. TF02-10]|uniref:hypothetical protein n=1 Tax=Georgenia sp. TF02-10 TaxID=2917725 RepID=UPI001FA7C64E|nr:hypothetical protein [Georgenia sp. TF02-10]UNX53460.1 hypothetical protein MF406_10660 [Georgenia sp. TF02-10]
MKAGRWIAVGAVAAAGLAVATTAATSVARSGADVDVTVVVSDAATSGRSDCPPERYERTFFDGAAVELADDAGDVLGAQDLEGAPTASERGCAWSATFTEVPQSPAYTVTLTTTDVPARTHTFEVDRERLAGDDWTFWVSAVS